MSPTNRCTSIAVRRLSTTSTRPCCCNRPAGPTLLRALLKAETERGPDFLRLANALSALYPKDSNEKRLLDAMLLAVPR